MAKMTACVTAALFLVCSFAYSAQLKKPVKVRKKYSHTPWCERHVLAITPTHWTSLEAVYQAVPPILREPYTQRLDQTRAINHLLPEQVDELVRYLKDPALLRMPHAVRSSLEYTLRQDLKKHPRFAFLINLKAQLLDGLAVLSEYDRTHGTRLAITTGATMIKTMLPEPGKLHFPGNLFRRFQEVTTAAIARGDSEAFKDFFEAASAAPTLDNFMRSDTSAETLLRLLGTISPTTKQREPDISLLNQVLTLSVSHRVQAAEQAAIKGNFGEALNRIQSAIELVRATSQYFKQNRWHLKTMIVLTQIAPLQAMATRYQNELEAD